MARALALVALARGVAYLFTPGTAGGVDADCFAFNTRFAVPAIDLGLIVLVLVLAHLRLGPLVALTALVIAFVLNIGMSFAATAVALLVATLVVITSFGALALGRTVPRAVVTGVVALAVAVAAVVGWYEQRAYLREPYMLTGFDEPIDRVEAVLAHVHHARIAVRGLSEVYPLFGVDLSNRVELPAVRVTRTRFAPYSSCPSWLLALKRGRYECVVTAQQSDREPPAASWTRRYPGARQLLVPTPRTVRYGKPWRWQVFKLTPGRPLDPRAACAGVAPSRRA